MWPNTNTSFNDFDAHKHILYIEENKDGRFLKVGARYGFLGLSWAWRHISSLWSRNVYNLDTIATNVLNAPPNIREAIRTKLTERLPKDTKDTKVAAIANRLLQQISSEASWWREQRKIFQGFCQRNMSIDDVQKNIVMSLQEEHGRKYILLRERRPTQTKPSTITIGLEDPLSVFVDGTRVTDFSAIDKVLVQKAMDCVINQTMNQVALVLHGLGLQFKNLHPYTKNNIPIGFLVTYAPNAAPISEALLQSCGLKQFSPSSRFGNSSLLPLGNVTPLLQKNGHLIPPDLQSNALQIIWNFSATFRTLQRHEKFIFGKEPDQYVVWKSKANHLIIQKRDEYHKKPIKVRFAFGITSKECCVDNKTGPTIPPEILTLISQATSARTECAS